MNKRSVMEKIAARWTEDLGVLCKAARDSHAEATHESNRAENKYDTRGLEASYLADGQVRQAEETGEALAQLQALSREDFAEASTIVVGALVELESGKERRFYFLASRGGGVEVEVDGKEIVVLTPQAPLGQMLVGRKRGAVFKMGDQEWRIRWVC